MLLNTLLIAIALLSAAILLAKRVRDNAMWRATVTPLASIIGSGFLVVVPLLGHRVGGYAPVAMAAVVTLAYFIGSAIRFNILYMEPVLAAPHSSTTAIGRVNTISEIALGIAYFISVTFYLRLLSSFVLRGFQIDSDIVAQSITSVILLGIGIAGWFRGLAFLERLEEYSVSIKLAIIASLLFGWLMHDLSNLQSIHIAATLPSDLDWWYVVRLMAGVLIVVQGFETSRYLGDQYDGATRVTTMRRAQLLSGAIYIAFIIVTVPSLVLLGDDVSETAIIDLSRVVSVVLPPMLVIAAAMSQLSAAVADTVATGGLVTQVSGSRFQLPAKAGYLLVSLVGVILVWTTDIFEIIALASRAFALYYALQCLGATMVAWQQQKDARNPWHVAGFALLSALLFVAVVIAIPAD